MFNRSYTEFVPIDVPDNLKFFPTDAGNLAFGSVYDPAGWVIMGVDPSAVNA
jgi:hypothetical protein